MSRQEIEMHFKEITGLAGQIKELSEQLKKMAADELGQIAFDTEKVWEGEAARKVLLKEVRLSEGILAEADILGEIADGMKEQAERFYQRELQNELLARVRSYG